ncbi:MAG: VCBS repeat-containing protein, partial [Planctomycetaceae bacterium]|nr:VCBS repeat-containing protein [Planctomycetaceae bacterium]
MIRAFGVCVLVSLFIGLLPGCAKVSGPHPEDGEQRPGSREAESQPEFQDRTRSSGLQAGYRNGREANRYAILESLGGGVGILDYDGDGVPDIFAPGGGEFGDGKTLVPEANSLYRGSRELSYFDAAMVAGCRECSRYTHGCAIADADNDGFPDIVVTGYGGLQFLRNLGDGTFQETADRSGLTDALWSSSAGWGDVNGDGCVDLYVAHYTDWSFENDPSCPGPGPDGRDVCPPRAFGPLDDTLFISDGQGGFTDGSNAAGLVSGGKGLGVLLSDFDHDNDTDIYVANDTTANFLYVNDGSGVFAEEGLQSGTSMDDRGSPNGSMGTITADFDDDLLPDLWVTNFESETSALYRNLGGCRFQHISRDSGVAAVGALFVGFGTDAADFDADGDVDIVIANGHVVYHPAGGEAAQEPLFLENQGNGVFVRRIPGPEGGYFQRTHVGRGL